MQKRVYITGTLNTLTRQVIHRAKISVFIWVKKSTMTLIFRTLWVLCVRLVIFGQRSHGRERVFLVKPIMGKKWVRAVHLWYTSKSSNHLYKWKVCPIQHGSNGESVYSVFARVLCYLLIRGHFISLKFAALFFNIEASLKEK